MKELIEQLKKDDAITTEDKIKLMEFWLTRIDNALQTTIMHSDEFRETVANRELIAEELGKMKKEG